MSYDIYLETQASIDAQNAHRAECPWVATPFNAEAVRGHECPEGDYIEVGNQTYNVGGMYADALGQAAGNNPISEIMGWTDRAGLYGLHVFGGAPCVEAAGVLAQMVQRMEDDPVRYQAMNPSNGWGSYEGALAYLRRFARLCAEHPERRIVIS